MPPADVNIVAYCGYNGKKYSSLNGGLGRFSRYSKLYGTNDVVGCGLIISDGIVFFTLNGVNQGD